MCFSKFVSFGTEKCVLCALFQAGVVILPQIHPWRAVCHLLTLVVTYP